MSKVNFRNDLEELDKLQNIDLSEKIGIRLAETDLHHLKMSLRISLKVK